MGVGENSIISTENFTPTLTIGRMVVHDNATAGASGRGNGRESGHLLAKIVAPEMETGSGFDWLIPDKGFETAALKHPNPMKIQPSTLAVLILLLPTSMQSHHQGGCMLCEKILPVCYPSCELDEICMHTRQTCIECAKAYCAKKK